VSDEAPGARPSLVAEFDVRRRLLAGYEVVRTQWPDRFAALATRIDRYELALAAAGLDPHHLMPQGFVWRRVARYGRRGAGVAAGAAARGPRRRGRALSCLPGRRFVATGMARGAEDALASIKVLAAMLLFPLTWAGSALAMWRWRGVEAALWTVGRSR